MNLLRLALVLPFFWCSVDFDVASAESLELVLQRNIAYLRASAGCSLPIDFDRAFFQHLRYAFTQRNVLVANIEVNFDYYTINKRYHIIVMADSRGVSTFAHRQKFRRNSLIPESYAYEPVVTSVSRPVSDICRGGIDRDQAVQEAVFTSLLDGAVTGLLPYETFVGATVCFTKQVSSDMRTKAEEIFELPNSRFYCCRPGEYLEHCSKYNRTVDDVVEVKGYSLFLYLLYGVVYCYLLPLVIAWVLCDVNCLEDGRTLSYVVNPKTVYFGYAQLGFPPIIKKVTFVLLGISGYALIAIISLTNRSPTDQLVFIICFLFLSVVLMFSAKRLVQADALRPADRFVMGLIRIATEGQHKTTLSMSLGTKTDLLLQQQDTLASDHPDIAVFPSISECSRLLFMAKYWSRYCKVLRRLCTERRAFIIALPLLVPLLLIAFVLNTVPLVQLSVFAVLQIRAHMIQNANGLSTLMIFTCSIILFIGYVALLLYIPCVLILCLYFTVLAMLHSIHLLMIGLAVALVIYQLGIFICQECEKFTYMTECVVKLNLTYLRYEGGMHRAPCCEQLVRSVPLNPNHVQINSIFFDSLVKSFFPLSHSLKTICFRAGLFLLVCTFLFAVLVQCGAHFFVTQAISLNLLLAVLVPKLVFSLWPCCSSASSSLPSPSVEQAIYILIDDWYRKNCQNSPKPSPAILKIGPGIDFISKMTPQLGTRDMVIANMMDQMPFSDNYYGTITTGKYSGNGSGSSPLTNYADTMPESGRYTLASSRGGTTTGPPCQQACQPCHQSTLPRNHNHVHNHMINVNNTCPVVAQTPNVLSNSLIKHAVFAPKNTHPHNNHTASTGDTSSEVDSILYYNDIVSKHPSERAAAFSSASAHRIYAATGNSKQCKNSLPNNLVGGDLSDESVEADSPLEGPGSPASYGDGTTVRVSVLTIQQQQHQQQMTLPAAVITNMRSQSETDESVL